MKKVVYLGVITSFGVALMWAQAAKSPAFDVASLKLDNTSPFESGGFEYGTLTIHYAPLRHLVASAYNTRIDLVEGGPDWIDLDRFEIVAKTSPETTDNEWRVMLQTLLIERFDLQARRRDIPKNVFVITSAKEGPKLTKASDDSSARVGCWGSEPLVCHKVTMQSLADQLPKYNAVSRPIVDETRIEGFYDFRLFFDASSPTDGAAKSDPSDTSIEAPSRSIFQSLNGYGLRMQSSKRPISVIVIDQVRRKPLPN